MSDESLVAQARKIANFYASIANDEHPAIVKAREVRWGKYCSSGYYCCFANKVYTSHGNLPEIQAFCPEKAWLTNWYDFPRCPGEDPDSFAYNYGYPSGVDDIEQRRLKVFDAIEADYEKSAGIEGKTALTQNIALSYSNERASEILYNSMYDSVVSILSGMIYTLLEAGAFAGYIAGASQVYRYIMNMYTAEANNFIQTYEPYNPPPIGLS